MTISKATQKEGTCCPLIGMLKRNNKKVKCSRYFCMGDTTNPDWPIPCHCTRTEAILFPKDYIPLIYIEFNQQIIRENASKSTK